MNKVVLSFFVHATNERDVVSQIRSQLGEDIDTRWSWGILFCGYKLDSHAVFEGVRDAFHQIPLWGGSLNGGIVSPQRSQGFECQLFLFRHTITQPIAQLLPLDQTNHGNIFQPLSRHTQLNDWPANVLFFAANQAPDDPRYPSANDALTQLVLAFEDEPRFTIAGAQLSREPSNYPGYLFCGDTVQREHAIAILLPPELSYSTAQQQTSYLLSSFMQVSEGDGDTIQSINGETALSFLQKHGFDETCSEQPFLLGRKCGDLYDTSFDADFQAFVVESANLKTGAITVYPPIITVKDHLQVILPESMEEVISRASALTTKHTGNNGVLLNFSSHQMSTQSSPYCDNSRANDLNQLAIAEVSATVIALNGGYTLSPQYQISTQITCQQPTVTLSPIAEETISDV